MSKKIVLVIISIVFSLLIVAVGFYFPLSRGDNFDIRKFNGAVVSVDGDVVIMKGFYDSSTGVISQDVLSKERDFSFKVNETTRFEKLDIKWPTWEEVRAAPGGHLPFKISELPQSRVAGSLEDINNLNTLNPGVVYMEVDFSESIYNTKNPVASFVFYKTTNMSPSGPPTPDLTISPQVTP